MELLVAELHRGRRLRQFGQDGGRRGRRTYDPDGSHTGLRYSVAQRVVDGSMNLTGYVVTYPDGAKDVYGFVPTALFEAKKVAFLSAAVDSFGHTNRFLYEENANRVLLKYHDDFDGRTNKLTYTNATYPALITGVEDPFGRTTVLKYDQDGMLADITDVVGLASSFKYRPARVDDEPAYSLWADDFQVLDQQHGLDRVRERHTWQSVRVNYYLPIRAVTVVNPIGGTNIYMLKQMSNLIYTNYMDYYTNYENHIHFIADSYDTVYPYPYAVPWAIPTYGLENYHLSTGTVSTGDRGRPMAFPWTSAPLTSRTIGKRGCATGSTTGWRTPRSASASASACSRIPAPMD